MPLEVHIKKRPAYFHRFDAIWTPTILIVESDERERFRIEGYLPKDEFRAHLELGLARVALMHKKWADAERRYTQIIAQFPASAVAPEAIYWKGICRYKETNDHTVLSEVPEQLKDKYAGSLWALKASVWT